MNDEEFKALYDKACATALEVNGHKTKAAINYLLQLVWDVHDQQVSHINWAADKLIQSKTDG